MRLRACRASVCGGVAVQGWISASVDQPALDPLESFV